MRHGNGTFGKWLIALAKTDVLLLDDWGMAGIDSQTREGRYEVYQFTGDPTKTRSTARSTLDWVSEVQARGAGEIVLNCMASDGVRRGYDIAQLQAVRAVCGVPLIASGGAGAPEHFAAVFREANVDGALAASVFHKGLIRIPDLKRQLLADGIAIRPPEGDAI